MTAQRPLTGHPADGSGVWRAVVLGLAVLAIPGCADRIDADPLTGGGSIGPISISERIHRIGLQGPAPGLRKSLGILLARALSIAV